MTHAYPSKEGVELPDLVLGLVVEAPLEECYLCRRGQCVQTMDDDEHVVHARVGGGPS